MNSRPGRFVVLFAVILIGLVVPLVLQSIALRASRTEALKLREQLEMLRAEINSFPMVQTEIPNRLAEEQLLDLLRLRAEVTRLREIVANTPVPASRAPITARATPVLVTRTEPASAEFTILPDRMPKASSSWSWKGFSTPGDTLESMLFAGSQGDIRTYLDNFTEEGREAMQKNQWQGKSEFQIMDEMRQKLTAASGVRIVSQVPGPELDGIVRVVIELEGERPERQVIAMQKVGGQWKFGFHGSMPTRSQ